MAESRDDEPLELQKEFVQSIVKLHEQDERGELETVDTDEFLAELDRIFERTDENIRALEINAPKNEP